VEEAADGVKQFHGIQGTMLSMEGSSRLGERPFSPSRTGRGGEEKSLSAFEDDGMRREASCRDSSGGCASLDDLRAVVPMMVAAEGITDSRGMLIRSLHSFFTKLFHKRVNNSARARDKIPRLTRTPSGTRTFFDVGSHIAVKPMMIVGC
jgi:hypothetical protein